MNADYYMCMAKERVAGGEKGRRNSVCVIETMVELST